MSRGAACVTGWFLLAGCCANTFHAALAPPEPRTFASFEVGDVAVDGLEQLGGRTRSEALQNAARLTRYLRQELASNRPKPGPVLRVAARFTTYRRQRFFVPGKAAVKVTFTDSGSGQVVARGTIQAGNPKLGRGSNAGCTTVEELGGGIVSFVDRHLR